MARSKVKAYKEQSFDHLHGLAGISDDQIAEHLKLYGGSSPAAWASSTTA